MESIEEIWNKVTSLKGKRKLFNRKSMTKESWGFELGEILADFENDKNEFKAVTSIQELLSKAKAETRADVIKELYERDKTEWQKKINRLREDFAEELVKANAEGREEGIIQGRQEMTGNIVLPFEMENEIKQEARAEETERIKKLIEGMIIAHGDCSETCEVLDTLTHLKSKLTEERE